AQLEAEAQIAAGERLALIGRMAAGVTHDLRNQLSVLEMLVTRMPNTPDIAEEIRRAGDSLRQLSSLAEDVTAFAKQHPPALTFTSIDAALFAKQAVDMVSLERPQDRGRITTQLAHIPDHFSGDQARLTTATLALLRNALEASAADRPVVLEIGNEGGTTYIRVDDEGPGLADDEMMVVFEPMYSGFGGDHPGLGLGLANLVARAHGGAVTLESRGTSGLSATIRLARGA
ncbi:MAG: two-component system NtrC family sensor kinase, partial [Bradymonadia bacterium]